NLKDHNEQVSFAQAVTQGLGKNQGLFFPHDLPEFSLTEIDEMLKLDFVAARTRSSRISCGISSRRLLVMKSRRKSWKSACARRLPSRLRSPMLKAMSVVWNCSTGQRWHLKISAVALWHKC